MLTPCASRLAISLAQTPPGSAPASMRRPTCAKAVAVRSDFKRNTEQSQPQARAIRTSRAEHLAIARIAGELGRHECHISLTRLTHVNIPHVPVGRARDSEHEAATEVPERARSDGSGTARPRHSMIAGAARHGSRGVRKRRRVSRALVSSTAGSRRSLNSAARPNITRQRNASRYPRSPAVRHDEHEARGSAGHPKPSG